MFFFSPHGWKWDIISFSSAHWRAVINSQYHGASRACGCPYWSVLREKYINIWKRQQLCKECLTRALCLMSSNRSSEELQEAVAERSTRWSFSPNPAGRHASSRCCCHGDDHAAHHTDSSRSAAAWAQTDERCSFLFRKNQQNLQLIYNTTQTEWSRNCGTARSCRFHRWQLQSDHSLLCCHRNTPAS